MKKPALVALMYHDVVDEPPPARGVRRSTPHYAVSQGAFYEHIKIARASGAIADGTATAPTDKASTRLVFTFDDGLEGVYRCAMPALNQSESRGVVLVITDRIGTAGYMTWLQLQEWLRSGHIVGSHGTSHRPLGALPVKEQREELLRSKREIEDRCGIEVNVLSFPHGHYTQTTVDAALDLGYRTLFTSDIRIYWDGAQIDKSPTTGRIPMLSTTSAEAFTEYLSGRGSRLVRMRLAKGIRNGIKSTVGVDLYRKVYRHYFGLVSD